VERVHRTIDAINRRELDAYLALMHNYVEATSPLAAIEGVFEGHDGIRRWWDILFDIWPDFTAQAVELHAVA
jgi:hypothetical protein